jgi:arsenical pump membrane protein
VVTLTLANGVTWAIAAASTLAVIGRPWRVPEAVWAMLGAASLVALDLVPWRDALAGMLKGSDVYLFLTGMMVLAELARRQGLFDWLAAMAARAARGSADRLFTLVYGVGVLVTVFLSNDATAVVLTHAVAAVVRAARARDPLPYLFACAFVANAASFVLPISNPANLVVYGSRLPSLIEWLPRYALPSAAAILATYLALRLTQRHALAQAIAQDVPVPNLSAGGRTAACGIAGTAVVLMAASALDLRLGLPTCVAGCATTMLVSLREQRMPWGLVRDVSWGVLPLVAGLFVLVEALDLTGVLRLLSGALHLMAQPSAAEAAWQAGIGLALGSNLINNLPAGLIAGSAAQAAQLPDRVVGAVLIGVDLGPNLSVTGSLATILWLTALRREGLQVGAWQFLKLGAVVMPPALLLAILALVHAG